MNLLVLQSGGPTAAINATLAGIIQRALTSSKIGRIYGAKYGIKGVIEDNVVRLDEIFSSTKELLRLSNTPAAALGSCRLKLPAINKNNGEYKAIFETLKKYDIGCLICIGGNDSMDTVQKLSQYVEDNGIEGISIMGAPKTIDNDLNGMDHSPGFGSAAKYIATTFAELWADCRVYDIPAVTIVEVMGRHVGWLTASAALACIVGEAPQLIYLPEVDFDEDKFIEDVQEQIKKCPAVLIAVSEGIKHADGTFVSDDGGKTDEFGHKQLSGTARVLADIVKKRIGCKSRAIELNLMQRCAAHLASTVDLEESRLLGAAALDRALSGISGKVSVVRRISDMPYKVEYSAIDVKEVANRERTVPREWINERGNFVTNDMLKYLAPLVGGNTREVLPIYVNLL